MLASQDAQVLSPRHTLPIAMIDGCDTLWETQALFDHAESEIAHFLKDQGLNPDKWRDHVLERELHNLGLYGFDKKRFPLSCVEAYDKLVESGAQATASSDVRASIESIATPVFSKPPRVRPGAEEMLEQLRPQFRLAFVAQGDVGVLENRLMQSGLTDYFEIVEIKESLDESDIRAFMSDHPAPRHIRIGNSVHLDYVPARAAGAEAILVSGDTWENESGELRRTKALSLYEVPKVLGDS